MNTQIKTLISVMAMGFGLAASPSASALVMTAVLGSGGENDCTGFFGGKANTICNVGFALTDAEGNPAPVDVSPIIAKYNFNNGVAGKEEGSKAFPSITGGEFTVKFDEGSDGSGTWSYTAGEDDPAVRYWVAKGGNDGFTLFWEVDAEDAEGVCDSSTASSAYTLACLNLAQIVTSGAFATTSGQALSHISWYDTDGGPQTDLPEPGVLFLMGAGLLGLGMARRRKSA